MKNVVITGSTRGISLGLIREFVRQGHSAVVSGRTEAACEHVVGDLTGELQDNRIIGVPCEVQSV